MSLLTTAYWHRRACNLARDLRAERDAAARLQAQYRSLASVADLFERQVAALRARLCQVEGERDDYAFQLECMSVDNADLERVNEALRGGLQFFDPTAKGEA